MVEKNGKGKRTALFGLPFYKVRCFRALLIYSILSILYFNSLEYLVSAEMVSADFIFDHWVTVLLVVMVPSWVMIILAWKSLNRLVAFALRFQELHGRICLRCGYELAEGLDVCSECGAAWSLKGLLKGYRKMADGEKG